LVFQLVVTVATAAANMSAVLPVATPSFDEAADLPAATTVVGMTAVAGM
jgi:hypothetical protein